MSDIKLFRLVLSISADIGLILNNQIIQFRKSDNYINATQLCKAGGKNFGHWYSLEGTKELISILAFTR